MADIQKYFEQFNKKICLGRFDEEQTLREKRDIVRTKLKTNLPKVFEKYDEECPSFSFKDHGSYDLGTGVKPLEGDYDIDQGLYFEVSKKDYDPVVLKSRVLEALTGHTKEVRMRKPCVTVFYQKDGEKIYHVDIAVYSSATSNDDGIDYLATGRSNSTKADRVWVESNPKALAKLIDNRFTNANERKQFRRIIRYLKRWKDIYFDPSGHSGPRGIALTVAAYKWFEPLYSDRLSQKMNDLVAIKNLVKTMLDNFQTTNWATETRRLNITLPVDPGNDLFEKMTDRQMKTFEDKLKNMHENLKKAESETDPKTACELLNEDVFGDDFPIPESSDTAEKLKSVGIIGSHESA